MPLRAVPHAGHGAAVAPRGRLRRHHHRHHKSSQYQRQRPRPSSRPRCPHGGRARFRRRTRLAKRESDPSGRPRPPSVGGKFGSRRLGALRQALPSLCNLCNLCNHACSKSFASVLRILPRLLYAGNASTAAGGSPPPPRHRAGAGVHHRSRYARWASFTLRVRGRRVWPGDAAPAMCGLDPSPASAPA